MANSFKEAVEATPEVANGYKNGLRALGGNSAKIAVSDSRKINGSLDIDKNTALFYPTENRWDYALDYDGKVYYVEVHPASTSEVSSVLKKMKWLKQWLKKSATKIDNLPKGNPSYNWIQSGKGALLPSSKEYKQAATNGIIPKPKLVIK